MDQDNPVVRLCARGMAAEQRGHRDEARGLFAQAWDARSNDYEGCIAAHYVARHQPDDVATWRWNLTALTLADATDGDRARGFYPSLHLNLASSYASLGDPTAACAHLDAAGERSDVLPDDAYRALIDEGIGNVRARLAE